MKPYTVICKSNSQTVSHFASVIVFLLLNIYTHGSHAISGPIILELNQVIDDKIGVQEQDEFLVRMAKDHTAIIRIERGSFKIDEELNLLITILSPEGDIIDELNTANDASFVVFNSHLSGNHKVIIRRWNGAASGNYKIVLDYLKETSHSEVEQIDNLISHFYNENNPGASILIQKNGKPYYKRSFGLADMNHNISITDSTVFDMASVSKQIAAFSIALLATEEKFDLRNSIRDFIPEFPEYGDNIAILHLVLNVSGIKDYDHILAMSGYDENDGDNITSDRILNAIMQFQEPYFQPGTEYRYSNSGYFIIAELISRVTGIPYAQWVKENIFIPLNMNDSYIHEGSNSISRNSSSSYKKDGYYDGIDVPRTTFQEQVKNIDIFSVHTTIDDYGKWMNNYKTGKVGGTETLKLIETGIHDDPDSWNWAFGFQKTKYKGINQKLSQGIIQGYRTYASYYPEMDVSLLYFTNDGEWRTFYLANKIADIVLNISNNQNEITSSYSVDADTYNISEVETKNFPKTDIDFNIHGDYYNSAISKNFVVTESNGKAVLKMFGLEDIMMEQTSMDTFKTDKWHITKLIFLKDEKGSVNGCKVYNSINNDFILFHKVKK